jgi:hypothetical protein
VARPVTGGCAGLHAFDWQGSQWQVDPGIPLTAFITCGQRSHGLGGSGPSLRASSGTSLSSLSSATSPRPSAAALLASGVQPPPPRARSRPPSPRYVSTSPPSSVYSFRSGNLDVAISPETRPCRCQDSAPPFPGLPIPNPSATPVAAWLRRI